MTTTTRPTLGARLAARIPKPRRRGATHDARRPRRDPADAAEARRLRRDRDAEVKLILKDVRRLNAERGLEQSHVGRHLLDLLDAKTKAGFREDFAALSLHAVQQAAEGARSHHVSVCSRHLHQQYEQAHFAMRTAEARVRRAKKLHRLARESREMIDCELRTLARTAKQAR